MRLRESPCAGSWHLPGQVQRGQGSSQPPRCRETTRDPRAARNPPGTASPAGRFLVPEADTQAVTPGPRNRPRGGDAPDSTGSPRRPIGRPRAGAPGQSQRTAAVAPRASRMVLVLSPAARPAWNPAWCWCSPCMVLLLVLLLALHGPAARPAWSCMVLVLGLLGPAWSWCSACMVLLGPPTSCLRSG